MIQVFYNQRLKEFMKENKLSTPPLIGKYENLFEAIKASHLLMAEESAQKSTMMISNKWGS